MIVHKKVSLWGLSKTNPNKDFGINSRCENLLVLWTETLYPPLFKILVKFTLVCMS